MVPSGGRGERRGKPGKGVSVGEQWEGGREGCEIWVRENVKR